MTLVIVSASLSHELGLEVRLLGQSFSGLSRWFIASRIRTQNFQTWLKFFSLWWLIKKRYMMGIPEVALHQYNNKPFWKYSGANKVSRMSHANIEFVTQLLRCSPAIINLTAGIVRPFRQKSRMSTPLRMPKPGLWACSSKTTEMQRKWTGAAFRNRNHSVQSS